MAIYTTELAKLADRPWRVRAAEAVRQLRVEQRTPQHTIIVSHEIALALADLIEELAERLEEDKCY